MSAGRTKNLAPAEPRCAFHVLATVDTNELKVGLVYHELRKLAAYKMANEAPGHTLQPTALVHEAWLRLVGKENQKWDAFVSE